MILNNHDDIYTVASYPCTSGDDPEKLAYFEVNMRYPCTSGDDPIQYVNAVYSKLLSLHKRG